MPKWTQRSRSQTSGRGGWRLSPWLLLGAVPIAVSQRLLRRNFRVNNPEMAMRHGAKLVLEPRRVLAVARQHDVLEFLAGGTLRLLRLAGSHVTAVVSDPDGQQRHAEADGSESANLNAAGTSGTELVRCYDTLRTFDFGKGSWQDRPSLERQLREIWEDVRPDLVFTTDPAFPLMFFGRPGHVVVGQAVVTVARALGDGSETKRPEVLFFGTREGNIMVDMGEVIEEKIEGVITQSSRTSDYPKVYANLARAHGRILGRQADVRYAEAFRALSLPPLHERTQSGSWAAYRPELVAERVTGPGRIRL